MGKFKYKKIKAKSLLSSRTDPDPWFGCKYNMNLYRGCEHSCIYCDSRSECYGIENFDGEILVKINAPTLLEDALKRKRIKGTIDFGAMTDPYTFAERKFKLTQECLNIIDKYDFPIHFLTKSNMVLRDLDLIKSISETYAAITFTITTVNDSLARKVEPYAPLPSKRLEAMKVLADNGIYTGVAMMPVLPFIEDSEEDIINLVEQVAESGGKYIMGWLGMTLRGYQREYFYDRLDEGFPGMREKYARRFGNDYECNSVGSVGLFSVFRERCMQLGLDTKVKVFQPEKRNQQFSWLD